MAKLLKILRTMFPCIILLASPVSGSLAATHLLVTHLGPCEDAPPSVLTTKELTITTQTYDSSLSGEFNVTEDIEDGWSVKAFSQPEKPSTSSTATSATTSTPVVPTSAAQYVIQYVDGDVAATATMEKCQDIRNTDTCDYFSSSWVVHHGCQDDDAEEIYTMLFHYATPEIECPIRAGSYKLDNYPFFTEDNFLTVYESKISTSVFGYTFRMDGYTVDQRNLFCIEAYLQLLYMRDHNWVGGKNKSHVTPAGSEVLQ